jgi:Flp pilus assembly pilin Flp
MIFSTKEEGQGLAEYGWTIVLIAILVVVVLVVLGTVINTELWQHAWDEIRCALSKEHCSFLLPAYLLVSRLEGMVYG